MCHLALLLELLICLDPFHLLFLLEPFGLHLGQVLRLLHGLDLGQHPTAFLEQADDVVGRVGLVAAELPVGLHRTAAQPPPLSYQELEGFVQLPIESKVYSSAPVSLICLILQRCHVNSTSAKVPLAASFDGS